MNDILAQDAVCQFECGSLNNGNPNPFYIVHNLAHLIIAYSALIPPQNQAAFVFPLNRLLLFYFNSWPSN